MTKLKQKEAKPRNQNNIKIFNRILLLLIVVAGSSLLVGVNDSSIKSFVLQQQKKKLNEVKGQYNDLEVRVMSLSSYSNLSKKIEGLKMVRVERVNYLNPATAVAKK